jgi:hypothetical protein
MSYSPSTNPQARDYPYSAVRDCLFNIFAATFHIWRPSPQPTTWRRAKPWWQGPTQYGGCKITFTHPLLAWIFNTKFYRISSSSFRDEICRRTDTTSSLSVHFMAQTEASIVKPWKCATGFDFHTMHPVTDSSTLQCDRRQAHCCTIQALVALMNWLVESRYKKPSVWFAVGGIGRMRSVHKMCRQ